MAPVTADTRNLDSEGKLIRRNVQPVRWMMSWTCTLRTLEHGELDGKPRKKHCPWHES